MYDMKALYQAKSVADAVALRLAHPEAQIIAGGSDVLVQMREGKRAGAESTSIYGLDVLRGVSMEEDGTPRNGPHQLLPHHPGRAHPALHIPVLGEAVDQVGGPQNPEHRHHRRQYLQWRHLRRLRLYPPRL